MKTNKPVTASQIAQAEFCPYQLFLQNGGAPLSKEVQARLDFGKNAHHDFNKRFLPPLIYRYRWLLAALIVFALALVIF